MPITIELNGVDLLARMRNFEDHLVERKTVKDERDWKKTAVAFTNSAPVGLPAVLQIGVRDNGEIETPQRDSDEVQKKFNTMMQRVYPRIAYIPKVINDRGQQALAVIIPGSELRPHFAGLSYVRKGPKALMRRNHPLPVLKINGNIRFRKAAIDEWVKLVERKAE